MGSKVTPILYRMGINATWQNSWFSEKHNYHKYFSEFIAAKKVVERYLDKTLYSHLSCNFVLDNLVIIIHTHRSTIVAEKIPFLKQKLSKHMKKNIEINIQYLENADIVPAIISKKIGELMEQRKDFRYALKNIFFAAMRSAKGITVEVKGRLRGSEIARSQKKTVGSMPLNTIRAKIDRHVEHVRTKSGMCSVKVCVFKGYSNEKPLQINKKDIK